MADLDWFLYERLQARDRQARLTPTAAARKYLEQLQILPKEQRRRIRAVTAWLLARVPGQKASAFGNSFLPAAEMPDRRMNGRHLFRLERDGAAAPRGACGSSCGHGRRRQSVLCSCRRAEPRASLVEQARENVAALVRCRSRAMWHSPPGALKRTCSRSCRRLLADGCATSFWSPPSSMRRFWRAAGFLLSAVEQLPVTGSGQVDLAVAGASPRGSAKGRLVSVMLANNETGIIQPISDSGIRWCTAAAARCMSTRFRAPGQNSAAISICSAQIF